MKKFLLLISMTVLILSACGPSTPAAQEQSPTSAITQEVNSPDPGLPSGTSGQSTPSEGTGSPYPYPAPAQENQPFVYQPAYPLPDTPVPPGVDVLLTPPAPTPDKGVVIGRLINQDTNEPLAHQTVYLGDKVPMSPGDGYTITVQEMSSPHTMADKEGSFGIGDVPPGTYFILVWTPFDASIIIDPSTGREMEITVEAGQTLDLGQIAAIDPLSN